jgi:hypothetical protein
MPSNNELYYMDQQGQACGSALFKAAEDGNTPAWRVIRPYYKSDAIAKEAIYGNIPDDDPLKNKQADQISARDFVGVYAPRFKAGSPNQQYASIGQIMTDASGNGTPAQPQPDAQGTSRSRAWVRCQRQEPRSRRRKRSQSSFHKVQRALIRRVSPCTLIRDFCRVRQHSVRRRSAAPCCSAIGRWGL